MASEGLLIGEAARALGVSPDTLRRWDRAGKLRTVRDAANRRRVPRSEVSRLGADSPVRVTLDGGEATSTGPQGSHQLSSMLGAGGLAIVPAGEGELPAGSEVEVEPL